MSQSKNTITMYELPSNIVKELCCLLDHDNLWKKAAEAMKYNHFVINEIETNARRFSKSPSSELLSCWSKHGHNVDELVFVLYRMDSNPYVVAMNCLQPYISDNFKKDLTKLINKRNRVRHGKYLNGNSSHSVQNTSQSSIPLAVRLIEQGTFDSSNQVCSEASQCNSVDNTQISNVESGNKTNIDVLQQVAITLIKYDELRNGANNWDPSNLLGSGGFGQVFKGNWNYLTVAVKRLTKNENKEEFIREMCLNQYRHENILPLYGYSHEGPESLLVYQLMTGGSLQDRLRCRANRPPLTWSQRHRIAHGTARGLHFLHNKSAPLIHGDIKPANILLDQCDTPKIGDFGLARKGPHQEERTHLKVSTVPGTRPYLPDEYIVTRCLSPAVDVFSYGVVMMEISTGLPAMDNDREAVYLSNYIHEIFKQEQDINKLVPLEDQRIADTPDSNHQLFTEFIHIGLHCTRDQNKRPNMEQVFLRLDGLKFTERNID